MNIVAILQLLQVINADAAIVAPLIAMIKGGQSAGITDEQLQAQMEAFLSEAQKLNASDMDPNVK